MKKNKKQKTKKSIDFFLISLLISLLIPLTYSFIINTEGAKSVEIITPIGNFTKLNPNKITNFNPEEKGEYHIKVFYDNSVKEYFYQNEHESSDKELNLWEAYEEGMYGYWCNQVFLNFNNSYHNNYSTIYDFNLDFKLNLYDVVKLAELIFNGGEEECQELLETPPIIDNNPEIIEWAQNFEAESGLDVEQAQTINNPDVENLSNQTIFNVVITNQDVSLNLNTTDLNSLTNTTVLNESNADINNLSFELNTPLIYVSDHYASGIITLKKHGIINKIIRCAEITNGSCIWEKTNISFEDNGTHVSFYSDSFSGYAGTEIQVINVHSKPTVGGYWKVNFNTSGKANLTIEAFNGTVWNNDSLMGDLLFKSLICGNNTINYSWINNKVFVKDYECNDTSIETSGVITNGKHNLKFVFGNAIAYAYNNASQDFRIQRGYSEIPTGATTTTIYSGTNYEAPSSLQKAFIRIISTRLSGVGHNSGGGTQAPAYFMTTIANPENLLNNITFERSTSSSTLNTRIYWEIIEYLGKSEGDDEMIVRDEKEINQSSGSTINGSFINIDNDSKVIVFITGQRHTSTTTSTTDRGLYTAEWLGASNTPQFTRGDGTGTSYLSYAVVEFTGKNWLVQRVTHTQTATGPQTETLTNELSNTSRAFLHVQVRTNSGNLDEQGVATWISSNSTISFERESEGTATQNVVAWLVENKESFGTPMKVQQVSGSRASGGSEPDSWTESINAVTNLNMTSVMGESEHGNGGGTAVPRGSIGLNLSSNSAVTLWQSDSGQAQVYRFSVVEWPAQVNNDAPIVTLIKYDNLYTNNNSLSFFFNTTDDYLGTLNCTLYHNMSGIWQANETKYDVTQNTELNITIPLIESSFVWNVKCTDKYLGSNFSSNNFTIYADFTTPSISNENATEITSSTAVIVWDTDESANSTIKYGTTKTLQNSNADSSYIKSHSLGINGLQQNTLYYYNVSSCDRARNCNTTGPFNFTTSNVADTTPPIISGVNSSPLETYAYITWDTDESANSTIKYGTTKTLQNISSEGILVKNHNLTLSSLTPMTFYYYNVTSCDSSGNCNTSGTHNFTTVDITAPIIISLDYPQNDSTIIRMVIDHNFTVSENYLLNNCTLFTNITGTWKANKTINNPVNGSNNISIYVPTGNYIWNIICYDKANLSGTYRHNNTYSVVDDPPESFLNSPTNNSNITTQNVLFNCTGTDDSGIKNIALYTDNDGTFAETASYSVSGTNVTRTFDIAINPGIITWNCLINDTYGQSSFAVNNRSFFIEYRNASLSETLIPSALTPLSFYNITGRVNLSDNSFPENADIRIFVNGTQIYEPSNGNDGHLIVNSDVVVNNYTYLSTNAQSNDTIIYVNNTAEFTSEDKILIIQMQRSDGIAGAYEYIENITVNNATTINVSNLENNYYSGNFNTTGANATQVIKVPQYTNVTILSGSVISPAWNGYTGGVIIFESKNFINFSGGIINSSEKGFSGGGCGLCGDSEWGQNGEGITGLGTGGGINNPPVNYPYPDTNSNGGVGGYGPSGLGGEPGAGGSYGTKGSTAIGDYETQPTGGDIVGNNKLTILNLGGGGGGGGDDDSTTPVAIGGKGAGIVIIHANKIINAKIYSNGEDGVTDGGYGGESGGGGGGTIWLKAQNMTFSIVNATGGLGKTDGGDIGGNGGNGRIRLDYQLISGTSSPSSGYNGTLTTTKTNNSGNYFYDYIAPSVDGYYNISIIVIINKLLNTSNSKILTVDSQNPSVSIDNINPLIAERIVNNVTINWTATDNNLADSFANVTYPDGELINVYYEDFVISKSLLNVTGNYTITVYAIDILNNKNITNSTFEVIDTISPSIENVTNGSISDITAIIQWDTNELANTTVNYGTTTNLLNNSNNSQRIFFHSVGLINLSSNTLYYYNVTSCDSSGNCNSSGGHNFTTASQPDSSPPGIFGVLSSPSETSAIITWNTTEESNSSVNYNTSIFLGLFSSDMTLLKEHSVVLSSLNPLTLYYYNITSCDLGGNCNTSGINNFTTLDTTAPVIVLLNPTNNTHSNSSSFDFNFSVSDNVPLNISYCTLFYNVSGNFTANKTISNINQSTEYNFSVNNFPSGTYAWNVQCNDSQNNSAFAVLNNTLFVDNIPPENFSLLAPANNSKDSDLTPLFNWTATNDTHFKNYTLQLSDDGTFSYINLTYRSSSVSSTYYQIVDDLTTGVVWYWRVVAFDSYNNSYTTNSFVYTTDSPPSVSLSSPSDNNLVGSNGTISFSCDVTDDIGLVNISLYSNRTGSWAFEDSVSVSGKSANADFSISGFASGTYVWNCLALDGNNQQTFAGNNYTFTTDSRFVNISISMIPNITSPSTNISFNGSIILNDGTPLPYQELFIYLNGTLLNPENNTSNFLVNKTLIPQWWEGSYKYRSLINITNNDANILTKSTTINVTINTSFLVDNNKMLANGSDLRIVYWNGSQNIELDRINLSAFNSTTTYILFKLQKNISISGYDDNYFYYYANPSADNPSQNPDNIYSSMEISLLEVSTDWQTVSFNRTYLNPVIITHVSEENQPAEEVVTRIKNIDSSGFDIRLQNPGSRSLSARNVSIMIIEEGNYDNYGFSFEAHIINDEAEVIGSGTDTPTTYDTINLGNTYSSAPTVVSQIMTYKDSLWTTDHPGSIGTTSFDIALEMGQYCDISGACSNSEGHDPENVGWFAIERAVGNLSGIKFDSGLTATNIQGRDNSPGCFFSSYSTTFSSVPIVFADLNVRNGADGGWSGGCSLNTTDIGFHTNEEDESDGESSHTAESATYVSFASEGQVNLIKKITLPTFNLGSEESGPSKSDSDGNFSYVFQAPLADGVYPIRMTVNYSSVVTGEKTVDLIVDSTAPSISLLDPSNNSFTNNNTPLLTYEVSDLSPVINCSLYINNSYNMTNSGIVSGNNTFLLSSLSDGFYSWKVKCYDYLGNNNITKNNLFIIDTIPPTININNPLEQENFSNNNIMFNYSFTDLLSKNATCNLTVDDGSFSNNTIYNNTNYAENLSINSGFRNFNVSCQDLAGNIGYSNNNNFTIISSVSNLRIRIIGNDSNVSWDSVEGTTSYEIYLSNNYSKFGKVANYSTVNLSIIDKNINSEKYYYVKTIRGSVEKNSSKAGFMRKELSNNSNLVSNPFDYYPVVWKNNNNDGFEFYSDCLESVWKYTSSGFLRIDWNGDYFTPGINSESFTFAETNQSYWIITNNTCNITYTGYVREENLTNKLFPGINSASYNQLVNKNLPTNYEQKIIFTNPENDVEVLNRFNGKTQKFETTVHYLINGIVWGWWPSINNQNFTNIEKGKGYYYNAITTGNLTQVKP